MEKSSTHTCLIVDDSRVVRRVLRRILEDMGYACAEADHADGAYEYCIKTMMPDAIMLDWNMPGEDGLEFLERLRAHERGDSPIVLFCTTECTKENMEVALAAGANEFIMKPFDEEIIRTKFRLVGLPVAS